MNSFGAVWNRWMVELYEGYRLRQQWRHKPVGCPVADCHLCAALRIREAAEKEPA